MTVGLQEPTFTGQGIMGVVSPDDVMRQENEARDKSNKTAEVVGNLAAFIHKQWEQARFAKIQIEERMLNNLRQRRGEYTPEKYALIRDQGGSEIYMMLTNVKCRAAESWINDIVFQPGEHPFSVDPTPIPDMPGFIMEDIQQSVAEEAMALQQQNQQGVTPEDFEKRVNSLVDELSSRIEQEAKKIAARMEDKIADQLVEGDFRVALKEFIKDVVTFPAGILRGPVIKQKKQMKWAQVDGNWKPIVEKKLVISFYRVSPFDIYPGANSRGINDGYLFERHRLRRRDLLAMKGVPGNNSKAIDDVLEQYGRGGLRDWMFNDQIRANLEDRPNEYMNGHDETIDAIEYNGSIQGRLLREWGMSEEEIPDENEEYEVNAWKIGSYVIRAVLNDDPLDRRTYHKACFEEVPGSFWGFGVPDLMSDVQDVCNATSRSLINNLAISSGPQVEVYADRVPPGEDITDIHPWKIWQMQSDPNGGSNNRAIQFYQPNSNAEVLIKVYDHFSRLADEYTGIPAYTYGSPDVGGAGSTASGLSMLMTAASRGIKQVIGHVDGAIEGAVGLVYEHNMMHDPDESIKGDVSIVARGSTSLMAKEQQQIRRNEFLDKTNNPVDMSIIGLPGRAAVLREAVRSLDIPVDDVVPDKDKFMQNIQQDAMNAIPPAGSLPGPANLDPAGNPAGGMNAFAGAA